MTIAPATGAEPAVVQLPPVMRQRLHETVVSHIRGFIVEGTLEPGQKLNERELCEMLGISRTPLREALKVLAVEGLIELSPNRGAAVARMSQHEIFEAFELLAGLEALSGELACERITTAQLQEIRNIHESMQRCQLRNDLGGYYARNQLIHDRINAAAQNSALRQTYLSVNRRLQALRFRSNFQTPKWVSAMRDHSEMLLALEHRLIHNFRRDRRHVTSALFWQPHEPL